MKSVIIVLISLISLSSFCGKKKSKSKTTSSTATTADDELVDGKLGNNLKTEASKDSAVWYKVSFISIGGGIDHDAIKSCKEFVAAFEKQHRTAVPLKIASWGREGEKDFCFYLQDMSAEKAKTFIAELEDNLKGSSLIRYKYNCKCDKYREIIPEAE